MSKYVILIFLVIKSSRCIEEECKIKSDNKELNMKIWVSMGLCWGYKTNFNGKHLFPYPLAGELSTKLWHNLFPAKSVTVIFHIIFCKNVAHMYFDGYNLTKYVENLEKIGALVVLTEINNCEECIISSQLIRMLSFNLPEVRFPNIYDYDNYSTIETIICFVIYRKVDDEDVILTADVDAFPMKKALMYPIWNFPFFKVWIYQYKHSLNFDATFPMSFIAMRSKTWKSILYNTNSTQNLIRIFGKIC